MKKILLCYLLVISGANAQNKRVPDWGKNYKIEYRSIDKEIIPKITITKFLTMYQPANRTASMAKVVKWRIDGTIKSIYNYSLVFQEGEMVIDAHAALIDVEIERGDSVFYLLEKD